MNALQQLQSLKGQLSYTYSVLNNGRLTEWEAKEYSKIEVQYVKEIKELELYIEKNNL